jgi:hypothetical protein
MSAILTYFGLIVTPKSAMSLQQRAWQQRAWFAGTRLPGPPQGALIGLMRPYRESSPNAKADGRAQKAHDCAAKIRHGRAIRAQGGNAMAVPFDQRTDLVWFDGRLIPTADCKINVLTHGLHYASAVFEGERAYGGEIFKSAEHSERLRRSAQLMDFEIPYSAAEIEAAERRLCAADRLARLGAARRFRAEQQNPPCHRHLGMAELF